MSPAQLSLNGIERLPRRLVGDQDRIARLDRGAKPLAQTSDNRHLERVVLGRERMGLELSHQLLSQGQVDEVFEPETVRVEARPLPVGEHAPDSLIEDSERLAAAEEESPDVLEMRANPGALVPQRAEIPEVHED